MMYIRILLILIILHASGAHAAVVWTGDFEEGDLSDFSDIWLQSTNCTTGSTATASTNAKRSGVFGFDIYYEMDDDPRGDCLQHQDNNTSGAVNISPSLTHYTFDGYFSVPADTAKFCSTPATQRKLLYFKPVGWGAGAWAFFLKVEPSGEWSCSTGGGHLILGYASASGQGASLYGDSQFNDTIHSAIKNNVWYHLRVEVEYGAYGNDRMQIWLGKDGETFYKILDKPDLTLRSASDQSLGLGIVEIGRQVDMTRSIEDGSYVPGVYEHRYWDDISIHSGSYTTPSSMYGGRLSGSLSGGGVLR